MSETGISVNISVNHVLFSLFLPSEIDIVFGDLKELQFLVIHIGGQFDR